MKSNASTARIEPASTNTRALVAYFTILVVLILGFVLGAKALGEQGVYLAQGYMLTPALAAILTRLFFYPPRFSDANLRLGRPRDYLGFWGLSIAITAVSYILFTVLGAIEWDISGGAFLQRMTDQFGVSSEAMLASLPPGFTLQTMLLAFSLGNLTVFNILPGLITGLGEELGHRGLMFPLLYRIRPWIGLFGGGLIWFAWHQPLALVIPSSASMTAGTLALKLLIGAIGSVCTFVYLAYVYIRSRNILVTAIAHIAMNNAAAAFSYYVALKDQMLADLGLALTMVLVVVALYLRSGFSVFQRLNTHD